MLWILILTFIKKIYFQQILHKVILFFKYNRGRKYLLNKFKFNFRSYKSTTILKYLLKKYCNWFLKLKKLI
jgi:hypothetical protein